MWGDAPLRDWLWNVAFDGIGSTLIAAALALWVLRRTIRNDRETSIEERLVEDCLDLARETQVLAAHVWQTARRPWGQPARGTSEPMDDDEAQALSLTLSHWEWRVIRLAQRLDRKTPGIQRVLQAGAGRAMAGTHIRPMTRDSCSFEIEGPMRQVQHELESRAADPQHLQQRGVDFEARAASIEANGKYQPPPA